MSGSSSLTSKPSAHSSHRGQRVSKNRPKAPSPHLKDSVVQPPSPVFSQDPGSPSSQIWELWTPPSPPSGCRNRSPESLNFLGYCGPPNELGSLKNSFREYKTLPHIPKELSKSSPNPSSEFRTFQNLQGCRRHGESLTRPSEGQKSPSTLPPPLPPIQVSRPLGSGCDFLPFWGSQLPPTSAPAPCPTSPAVPDFCWRSEVAPEPRSGGAGGTWPARSQKLTPR